MAKICTNAARPWREGGAYRGVGGAGPGAGPEGVGGAGRKAPGSGRQEGDVVPGRGARLTLEQGEGLARPEARPEARRVDEARPSSAGPVRRNKAHLGVVASVFILNFQRQGTFFSGGSNSCIKWIFISMYLVLNQGFSMSQRVLSKVP